MSLKPRGTTRWTSSAVRCARFARRGLRSGRCCHGCGGWSTASHVSWSHAACHQGVGAWSQNTPRRFSSTSSLRRAMWVDAAAVRGFMSHIGKGHSDKSEQRHNNFGKKNWGKQPERMIFSQWEHLEIPHPHVHLTSPSKHHTWGGHERQESCVLCDFLHSCMHNLHEVLCYFSRKASCCNRTLRTSQWLWWGAPWRRRPLSSAQCDKSPRTTSYRSTGHGISSTGTTPCASSKWVSTTISSVRSHNSLCCSYLFCFTHLLPLTIPSTSPHGLYVCISFARLYASMWLPSSLEESYMWLMNEENFQSPLRLTRPHNKAITARLWLVMALRMKTEILLHRTWEPSYTSTSEVRSWLQAKMRHVLTVSLLLQQSSWATWWAAIGLLETFLISGLVILTIGHVLYQRFIHLDGKY